MPLVDRCIFNSGTSGLSDFTVASAVTGFMTPASAGAANAQSYSYAAQTLDNTGSINSWEVGISTYVTASSTVQRTTVLFSSALNAKVNFSAPPIVTLTALENDILQVVVNDTNVTGTLVQHTLTLGWTGTLALSRLEQGTNGQIIVGQTSSSPLYRTMSGDATLAASGALTLASVISAGGPTGSATVAPIITYDAKGRLTTVSSATITPALTNITGLGTGVATALAVNVGTDGAFVVKGGALGSPSSVGTMPAFTLGGAISGGGNQINNVIVGTSTPLAGFFTNVTVSGSSAPTNGMYLPAANTVSLAAGSNPVVTIRQSSSSGANLLVANNFTGAISDGATPATGVMIAGTGSDSQLWLARYANATNPPRIQTFRSRGTTINSFADTVAGDVLMAITSRGVAAGGTSFSGAGTEFRGEQVAGSTSGGGVPAWFVWATCSPGGSAAADVMWLQASGGLSVGASTDGGAGTIRASSALISPVFGPTGNSTTAIKITKADLTTSVMTFDTTNARVGINKTPGAFDLDVNGAVNIGGALTPTTINAFTLGGTVSGGGNQINNVIIGTSTPLAGSFTTVSASTSATVTATINATSTDGIVIQNTTAASAGAQQWSPRLHFIGQGWKTNSTAASRTVDWIEEVQPIQGAANPTSALVWSRQINAGGYTEAMRLTSAGWLGLGNNNPDQIVSISSADVNGTNIWVKNSNSSGLASFSTFNDSSTNAMRHLTFGTNASGTYGNRFGTLTSSGLNEISATGVLVVGTNGANPFYFGTNTVVRGNISATGSFLWGTAALATNATDGFLYIPTCAGTPTGTPTTATGLIPMIYDTSAHQFWFYDGGWKQPKTPAGAAIVTWQ